jgi:hypothetical protein
MEVKGVDARVSLEPKGIGWIETGWEGVCASVRAMSEPVPVCLLVAVYIRSINEGWEWGGVMNIRGRIRVMCPLRPVVRTESSSGSYE